MRQTRPRGILMDDGKVRPNQEYGQSQALDDIAKRARHLRPGHHQAAQDGGATEMRRKDAQGLGLGFRDRRHAFMSSEPHGPHEAWIVFEDDKERIHEALRPCEAFVEAVAGP